MYVPIINHKQQNVKEVIMNKKIINWLVWAVLFALIQPLVRKAIGKVLGGEQ